VLFGRGTVAASEATPSPTPAVDVVTTSYGIPGSPPSPSTSRTATRGRSSGKLHFGAADNSPGAVDRGRHVRSRGGASAWPLPRGHQRRPRAVVGHLVDIVSDFTQTLPYCSDCESGREDFISGTSFATPRSRHRLEDPAEARRGGHVGGPVSRTASDRWRRRLAGLTPWQLRRALEQAAYYPVWRLRPRSARLTTSGRPLVVDEAAFAQIGWGVVSPDEVRRDRGGAARLGVAGTATREKSARRAPSTTRTSTRGTPTGTTSRSAASPS
jgi:hypothetical protein